MDPEVPDTGAGAEPVVAANEAAEQEAEDKAFAAGASTPVSGSGAPGIEKKPESKPVEKPAEEKKPVVEKKADEKPVEPKKDEGSSESAEAKLKKIVEASGQPAKTPEEIEAERVKAEQVARQQQIDTEAARKANATGPEPSKVNSVEELLKLPGATDVKIPMLDGDGGTKDVSLADMAKDMPEIVYTSMAVAKLMLQALQIGGVIPPELQEMGRSLPEIQQSVADLKFWNAVQVEHPDALKITKSKKFSDWCESNPLIKGSKVLDDSNPATAVAVLDAYKEAMAKETLKRKESEDLEKKNRKANLHGDGLRDTGEPVEGSDEDEDAAFLAGTKAG
jgi:hypothetical protein